MFYALVARSKLNSRASTAQIATCKRLYIIEEMITDGLVGIRRVHNIGLALTLAFGRVAVELLSVINKQ